MAGSIGVRFWVSTSGSDCDWVVKIIDVFPDSLKTPRSLRACVNLGGYQMLVRGDVMRGKFRHSLSRTEPFVADSITELKFDLNDVLHSFHRGHRIMVQVQSTWFPMIDRNPGRYMNIYEATRSDFQRTTQRVYRTAAKPSRVLLPILRKEIRQRTDS